MQGPLDGFETPKSHSHRRCYCLFLRGDGSDLMSRANVYSCSPKYWASCVLRLSWRCWSFNPVVYPQWWEQQKVSGNQPCCDNNRGNYFKHLNGFVLRGQVTRQTLNWLPVRQERESAFLDSAQWSLQKPWDGDLVDSEDRITPSGEHPDTDEVMAVAKWVVTMFSEVKTLNWLPRLRKGESVRFSAPNGHWRNHWMEVPSNGTPKDTIGAVVGCALSDEAMAATKWDGVLDHRGLSCSGLSTTTPLRLRRRCGHGPETLLTTTQITLIWLPASSERESVVLSAPNGHAVAIGWRWASKITISPSMATDCS